MIHGIPQEERIIDIQCGSKHTLAISSNQKIYSWGDAQGGKLGLGYSQRLKNCIN